MIDDRLALLTPEGAELNLVAAGPLPRTAAFLIDLAIRAAAYLALAMVLGLAGRLGPGPFFIAGFLLEWFYPVLFEVIWNGQTPGKRSLNLAVVHADGTPLTLNGSLIRNLLRVADLFPACYLTGYLAMLCTARFQRLGDLAADTMVVHLTPAEAAVPPRDGPAEPPDWPVTLDDQRTLVGFLERGTRLSSGRRQELAHLAYPELDEVRAEARALAHARYLLGER